MDTKTIRLNIPQIPIEKESLNELFNKYFLNKEVIENTRNYDKTCSIELKDMGNDRETWFVTEILSKNVIEIGDYNYRSKPSFMDYSPKYKLFFYILSSWSYKGGTHYYLHIHHKEIFYDCYLSHDNYVRLAISPCGEWLIISIKDLNLYEIKLENLVEALENDTILTNGQYYVEKEELEKKRELERRNDEAKMAYRVNYPDEYGDD